MNDTAQIFALALASNHHPERHFKTAFRHIAQWGEVTFSSIYLIPCRDGVGADYWNAACILTSKLPVEQLSEMLKQMEHASGRVRPSHQISLDLDLIAWGSDVDHMQFNSKKLPLALDVKIPLFEIWQNPELQTDAVFPKVKTNIE